MSKLRELIEAAKKSRIHVVGTATTYEEHLLRRNMRANADSIADLIDETKGAHADCKIIRCEVCAILERMGEK